MIVIFFAALAASGCTSSQPAPLPLNDSTTVPSQSEAGTAAVVSGPNGAGAGGSGEAPGPVNTSCPAVQPRSGEPCQHDGECKYAYCTVSQGVTASCIDGTWSVYVGVACDPQRPSGWMEPPTDEDAGSE